MIYLATGALDGLLQGLAVSQEPAEAEVLVLGSRPVDLSAFPRLRGVFRAGIGDENVPWDEARRRGIAVGLPSDASAELLRSEVAAFACHLVLRMAYADVGDPLAWRRPLRPPLSSRRLLVVGAGRIGGRVARSLADLMDVTAFDARQPRPELRRALSAADVVTLHAPLAPNTRGLLGAGELAALPDGSAIVNTARAALVDEAALLAEVSRGRIRAAFDVFWEEPYRGPLAAFHPDRFLMTPHVAGASSAFREALAADLRAFLRTLP